MAKQEILAGATDQTIDVFILDSSSTVGAGLTGLVFNTPGLTCYYRKGATGTPTALTLATQTVGGAHADGGFVAVDGTNCPGQYRLDLSDTIVATAGMVTLYLQGAANMAPCVLEIEVVSVNKFDSVRMGMTALPNAAADAAGGLPISDAGGLDMDAIPTSISTAQADLDILTGTDGALLDSATTDLYHADIEATVDEANTQDEYTITWFKNGARVTSGITVPTIQVVKRADGTDLIASSTPTQIGSTGSYKHDETSGRLTAGEAAIVLVGATIDGSARTFARVVSRDSTA